MLPQPVEHVSSNDTYNVGRTSGMRFYIGQQKVGMSFWTPDKVQIEEQHRGSFVYVNDCKRNEY